MMRFALLLGSIWVIFAVEHLVVERARGHSMMIRGIVVDNA